MGTKVFRELGSLKLISDERDVMVPAEHRMAVLDWCAANGIAAEPSLGYPRDGWAIGTFGVTLWRVKDERQRVMFVLRWAGQ